MKNLVCLLLIAVAVSSALAQTDEYIVLDRRAEEFDRWQDRLDYTYGTTVISRETNVPMIVLEEQRTKTHFGYGGLTIANALALETGKTFDEIVSLKSSGSGWGRIARENNVDLAKIVGRLDRVEGEFRNVPPTSQTFDTRIKAKDAKSGRGEDKSSRQHNEAPTKVKTHRSAKKKPK